MVPPSAMESGGSSAMASRMRVVTSDRKSTRLNSSHLVISYAVFCFGIIKVGQDAGPDFVSLVNRLSCQDDQQRVGFFVVGQFHGFFNDTATTEIYTLSLHDALPI